MNYIISTYLKPYKYLILGGLAIIILVFIVVTAKNCGKNKIKIDEAAIQKINSKNEAERKEALQNIFDRIDDQRNISDEKRREIIQRVEQSARADKNVTAEDLHNLVEDEPE